ncbi:S41 family peptidase [Arsukibacterium sp.]|uniref:S41 family peptidase n=1 Tax=Arsukibacterium sp. TaxID=1977258 RepID=UPI002FDB9543
MRYLYLLLICLLLSACGDSNSHLGDQVQCGEGNLNSQILCRLNANYLWYRELKSGVDPLAFSDPSAFIRAVRADRDRFSFIISEQEYQDRYINAVFFGFGFATTRVDNDTALQVLYVYDSGSAAQQGLRRGDKITAIEGISVAEWLTELDAGRVSNDDIYGPNQPGIARQFSWQQSNGTQRLDTFTKGSVRTNTVMQRSVSMVGDKKVGYLVFHTFIELSETELEQAFSFFAAQNIDELVLDLRYNGGGLIRVANQLSSQIAFNAVQGKTFVEYRYNDKNSQRNSSANFALGAGRTVLNLPRVLILTTPGSCSSSELVINALSPFVDVVQIGQTTCGKPVGQQPERVGDYRLFAINFQTVNSLGFGDYFDGLAPNCAVTPNIAGDWGVANDNLFAAALYYIEHGSCPQVASSTGMTAGEAVFTGSARNQPAWRLHNEQ